MSEKKLAFHLVDVKKQEHDFFSKNFEGEIRYKSKVKKVATFTNKIVKR
jgi:hypothetical protein